MPNDLSLPLRETIEREVPHLRALSDEAAAQTDGREDSWTRKRERSVFRRSIWAISA
jgi:hypothetical protein